MAVLVEVTRGMRVESWHLGAIAVVDDAGNLVASIGDIESPVFGRSAIKGLQALPFVESGAVEAFKLDDKAISVACASHNGEPVHVETVKAMLAACGLDEGALECGAQMPELKEDQARLHKAGLEPSPLHNNCSGKHAGFLCFAQAAGFDPAGYVGYEHPVQREVRAVYEQMTGWPLGGESGHDLCGIDGCSIPTYATPLQNMAHAFARFGTGNGLDAKRAEAASRLRKAVAAEPYMVAGKKRFCTSIMEIFGERAFVKTGAEGVFCASLPEQGLGVAIKCWDGASRASEVMMAAVIDAFLPMSEGEAVAMEDLRAPKLKNRKGLHVGDIKLVDGALSHLMQRKTV
ncbi:asparaginase [Cohaesibacter sp. ES.047]|uniref:asparaginase n=1 Tax=Cohaesibacter sp. ES.047 TaxID=1798205 RepID=UPI000BB72E6E|nr:asparaginase [Cohaesibacter sp. ES.047]SNY92740.1 asparaginase [Cohaesibacter sp. ES.047]